MVVKTYHRHGQLFVKLYEPWALYFKAVGYATGRPVNDVVNEFIMQLHRAKRDAEAKAAN
jgi:hypothetical protein